MCIRDSNEAFRKLIGEDCELYEIVKPKRLYTRILTGLGMKNKRTPLVMLVDVYKRQPLFCLILGQLYPLADRSEGTFRQEMV